jgi:hypothetical protein
MLADFVEDWLELHRLAGQTKDPKRHPEWTAAFATALRSEVTAFAAEVAFRGARDRGELSFATLLAAPWTMASAATAGLYGAARPAASTGFARVELDPAQRAGVLTSGAFLAAHAGASESLPVVRGATIRQHLLCQEMQVPPGVMVTSPAPDPRLSTRQRFTQHSQDPACAGCHALVDPIGFGLESYDAVGRWRSVEGAGIRIDASGELRAAGDADGPFTGGVELGRRLGGSRTAAGCFARQMFSYLGARPYDESADACALGFVERRLVEARGDILELVVAIAVSDPFLYRRVPERGP